MVSVKRRENEMIYDVFTAVVKHEWKGVRLFNVLVISMVRVIRGSLQAFSNNEIKKGFFIFIFLF